MISCACGDRTTSCLEGEAGFGEEAPWLSSILQTETKRIILRRVSEPTTIQISHPRTVPRSELLPTGMLCTAWTLRGSTPGLEELGAGLTALITWRIPTEVA